MVPVSSWVNRPVQGMEYLKPRDVMKNTRKYLMWTCSLLERLVTFKLNNEGWKFYLITVYTGGQRTAPRWALPATWVLGFEFTSLRLAAGTFTLRGPCQPNNHDPKSFERGFEGIKISKRVGDRAQRLRSVAALAENQSSIPTACMVTYYHLQLQFKESHTLF